MFKAILLVLPILFQPVTSILSTNEVTVEQERLFSSWAEYHGKTYSSPEERHKRLQIWVTNDTYINDHNSLKKSWTMAHNHMSDFTYEEYVEYYKFENNRNFMQDEHDELLPDFNLAQTSRLRGRRTQGSPTYINWVEQDKVTGVKQQGTCGSCWAFSSIAVLESYVAIHTGVKTTLSEQELIDCDDYDSGCDGGRQKSALKYVSQAGGVCSEADYPYTATDELDCLDMCTTKVAGTNIPLPVFVTPKKNSQALANEVSLNPVAVVMDSSPQDFMFYAEGIYDGTCSSEYYNHGVAIVGYGVENGIEYWYAKNSWGPTWGSSGYFKLKRDSSLNGSTGKCAVLWHPTTIP